MATDNIYITWHYTTHGIAYLKHVLSAFWCGLCKVTDTRIDCVDISQEAMNEIFDTQERGFLFDKVYYLTAPQAAFDRVSTRRHQYHANVVSDSETHQSKTGELWNELKRLNYSIFDDCLEREIAYVAEHHPGQIEVFRSQLWREMQHYSIQSQIDWFCRDSNAAPHYASRFEVVPLEVDNLRDVHEIASALHKWLARLPVKHADAQFFVNLSLGSNETQVVWHILSELGIMPPGTRLLTTYDNKASNPHTRFKPFTINEVPGRIISSIQTRLRLYENPTTPYRRLVQKKMETYLRQGVAILLVGERGIGKSRLVEEFRSNAPTFAAANCASFDTDSKAEAELFGYEKGAFTGATAQTEGLFHQARGGILFLDEVHQLSRLVQGKLMKALQTDMDNNFKIRRMGAKKEEVISCTVIFATNRNIEQLRNEDLLPDFYDRISQLIIELPPLRLTPDDRIEDWKSVWKQMLFDKSQPVPLEEPLIEWLRTLSLEGNYRDLQKIAIYYKAFLDFDKETKHLLGINSPYEFARTEYNRYYSRLAVQQDFDPNKTPKEAVTLFQKRWAESAIAYFGSAEKVCEHYKKIGTTITSRTVYAWKNGK